MLTDLPPGKDQPRRFEAIWSRLIETFESHRSLWRANYEIFSQIQERPEIREILGGNVQAIRGMLAALFIGVPESEITEEIANSVGAFHHVLLSGMIGQWLVDAEHALSAAELTRALRQVGTSMQPTADLQGTARPSLVSAARHSGRSLAEKTIFGRDAAEGGHSTSDKKMIPRQK